MNVCYRLAGEGPPCVQGWTPQVWREEIPQRDQARGLGAARRTRLAMSQGLTADLGVAAAAMDPQGCDQRHSVSTGSDAPYMTEDSVACM